jgi:hypothetical protein
MKQRVLDVPGLPIKTIADDTNRALFDKSKGINPLEERADAHVLPTSNRPGFFSFVMQLWIRSQFQEGRIMHKSEVGTQ